jgi:hypothetical protein
LAGIDSLQLAKLLVSNVVAKLALFDSFDVIFTGYQYSALRLGEDNFRLGLYGELGDYGGLNFEEVIAHAQTNLRVWVGQWDKRKVIALPESTALDLLPKIAVFNSPGHLEESQPNCAVSAIIDGSSVLIWRHQLLSQPIFELHTAKGDVEAICLAAALARSQ